MILASVLSSFLVALVRGGKLHNLENHRLKLIPLIILSVLCEVSIMSGWLNRLFSDTSLARARLLLALCQYLLAVLFLLVNIFNKELRPARVFLLFIMIGTLLNGFVIIVNTGQMPVLLDLLQKHRSLPDSVTSKIMQAHHYVLADNNTKFVWLADFIPLWIFGWYLVSPGDFFISLGLFGLVQKLMRPAIAK